MWGLVFEGAGGAGLAEDAVYFLEPWRRSWIHDVVQHSVPDHIIRDHGQVEDAALVTVWIRQLHRGRGCAVGEDESSLPGLTS